MLLSRLCIEKRIRRIEALEFLQRYGYDVCPQKWYDFVQKLVHNCGQRLELETPVLPKEIQEYGEGHDGHMDFPLGDPRPLTLEEKTQHYEKWLLTHIYVDDPNNYLKIFGTALEALQ